MTLRDYFAASAMQSLISLASKDGAKKFADRPQTFRDMIAEGAFLMADAMLDAREKQSPTISKSTLP